VTWQSVPQDLHFSDDTDVFAAADYDTGPLPASSPL